jgi:hypothetical protein
LIFPINNDKIDLSVKGGKTKMKKIGFLFVTVLMLVLFAVSASAETTEDHLVYTANNGEVTIIDYDYEGDELLDVVIPNEIDGYPVTAIGESAFSECAIASITIPSSVTTIADGAFVLCPFLKFIKVDENNEYFSNDKDGVLFNKDKTKLIFYPCGYEFPINHLTLYADNLKKYTIPQGVEIIGRCAFVVALFTELIIPDSVTTIESKAFCESVIFNLTIPGSVKRIDDAAFNHTPINSLIISEGVEEIGESAFYCCDIDNIMLPVSLKKIERNAFCSTQNAWSDQESINVFYLGSEEQWSEIEIEKYNEFIIEANTCYNYNCDSHSYISEIVKVPDCSINGEIRYTCECGWSYCEWFFDLDNHDMSEWSVDIPATCTTNGVESRRCTRPYCQFAYVETRESQKTAHSYNKVVTAPTCKEKGYTTYTCKECGHSYIGDYVGIKPHSYASAITKPATHLVEGVRTYTCTACGESYTDTIAKTKEHSYTVSNTVAPTCEGKGYTVYACACGDSYKDNYISATGHNYDGVTCTKCGENCSCKCHKGGISGFFWKIGNFFNKLFKIKSKQFCACGVDHY